MEQTMTHCIDKLVDNVSQVTDPVDISFDASVLSSLMPTGWKTGLTRSYQRKLHTLPSGQHNNLCDKIDEMAKNLTTTGDRVSYAMFLIDWRIKHNEDTEADEVAWLLSINDNVSIRSELETVPENDAVKLPKSTVIIKGVPEPKPAAIMVKTVLSDDASEVSLLCDHLIAQQAQQAKLNQAILKQIESLG